MSKSAEIQAPIVEGANVTGKRVYAPGGSIRDSSTPVDEFTMREEEKERWGVTEDSDYVPYYARDSRSRVWQDDPNDRISELMREYPGAHIAADDKGTEFKKGTDLVLMKLPRHLYEQRQAETDAANEEWERDLRAAPGNAVEHSEKRWRDGSIDPADKAAMVAKASFDYDEHQRSGMVGGNSPTAGMRYREARAMMERKGHDIEGEEAFYREGGRAVEISDESFIAMFEGKPPASAKSKTFGVGQGLGNKNPNSPLAVAQRRAAKAAVAQKGV